MRGESHRRLGRYLVEQYMAEVPPLHQKAFLTGCIEPDRNPLTYLKGSLRHQWLRGHNYPNARRYMTAIARRLENKQRLNLLDYYALGKLIHYTTDAFTYPHNETFSEGLLDHRTYEVALQEHFLQFLSEKPTAQCRDARTIMEAIRSYHREYQPLPGDLRTDSRFALNACCCVLAVLFLKPI